MKQRIGAQTFSFILQCFDAVDQWGVARNYKKLPIGFGSRYSEPAAAGALDGIPELGQVALTQGPIGGWICWPGVGGGGRKLAQWAQAFAVKITSASPMKATPIEKFSGGAWAVDATLAEQQVYTQDGVDAAVGTFGLVVAGTDLFSQQLLFFQGGSGGGTPDFPAKIVTNPGAGSYTFAEVDPATNVVLGGGRTGTAKERGRSAAVNPGQQVDIKTYGGAYYFFYPVEAC